MILKGAPTVTATPQGEVFLNSTGGSYLSQGGTGDVLAGLVTSLWAQGAGSVEAAVVGAFLHGLAGSIAAERLGRRGIPANEVAENLPRAFEFVLNHPLL